MKPFLLTAAFILASFSHAAAQYNPYWQWAKADTTGTASIPGAGSVLAVKNKTALWAHMTGVKMVDNGVTLGSYSLAEYDSTGRQRGVTVISGKLTIMDVQADAAGNWYLIGRYYDSLVLPNATFYVRPTPPINPDPDNFIIRLKSSFLTIDWVKFIGPSKTNQARAFTMDANRIYLAVDTTGATLLRTVSLATGDYQPMFRQAGKSVTTSIQVDAGGNIYLAGSCADKDPINFGGVVQPTTPGKTFAYVVKYRADGSHAWHHWLNDPTCAARKLTLFKNILYYTGTLNDSLTLGSTAFHRPPALSDYLAARLDTLNGTVLWTRQADSATGETNLSSRACHAAVTPDSALVLFAQGFNYVDWRDGINSNLFGNYNAVAVSVGPDNHTRWERSILGDNTSNGCIVTEGDAVWVSGNAYTTTGVVRFDTLNLRVPAMGFVPYFGRLKLTRPPYVAPPNGVGSTAANAYGMYPNPARTTLIVSGLPARSLLTLRDISGRVVLQQAGEGGGTVIMNVASLPRGMYFLHLQAEGGVQPVRKVLLQ